MKKYFSFFLILLITIIIDNGCVKKPIPAEFTLLYTGNMMGETDPCG